MTAASHYSVPVARRSLWRLLTGRVASALMGVVWLLWLVRQAPTPVYGGYVALLALLEMFYLVTGFGVSTMAQRYVAELRLKASYAQFVRLVRTLVLRRLGYALAGSLALALVWEPAVALLRLEAAGSALVWTLAWLVVGCLSRNLDELLAALMLHGISQAMALLANLTRLAGLWLYLRGGGTVDMVSLIQLEVVAACLTSALGLGLLWSRLQADRSGFGAGASADLVKPAMWVLARRFYLVQMLGQLWGPNAARLLVSAMAGPAGLALYGFVHALIDLLRNYLPAFLLATWVRPLMVTRYVASSSVEPAAHMAGALLKLSLIVLMPVLALVVARGDALVHWLSGGRYREGAGLVAALLLVLLAMQVMHLCLGMVCATVERARANVQATAGCSLAMLLAWLLWPWLGLVGLPAVMCVAEMAWVAWVSRALRDEGFLMTWDWSGLAKVLVSGVAAFAVCAALPELHGVQWLIGLLASGLTVLMCTAMLRPLSAPERQLVGQVVPLRWLPA